MTRRLLNNRLALTGAGLVCLFVVLPVCAPGSARETLPLETIELPQGFSISLYASVPGARSLTVSPTGTLFVGTLREGNVYAVVDTGGDHVADRVVRIASDLHVPNGVAFRNGALYVAEIDRVLRYDDIENRLDSPPSPVVVNDDFPDDMHHGWKFIRFGPDGKLYVPVGAPCNVCEREDERYGSIMRMNADGSDLEVFVRGVRNSVGFDWDPVTGDLWFTDNGRDMMGDDIPPDELNHAPQQGMHFGFPYCHGGDIPDPGLGGERSCAEFTPPARKLGPHVASLGMRFYTGTMFPEEYRNAIFIAEHGSWNRSRKIGYRVSLVRITEDGATYETFARGWLGGDEDVWGRPVDVEALRDGSLLVSDDMAGAVYRIAYGD